MLNLRILALCLLFCSASANATFYYYFGADDPVDGDPNTISTSGHKVDVALAEAAWEAQVRQLWGPTSIVDFVTNAANVRAASSSSAVQAAIDSNLHNINLSNPTSPTGSGSDHSNATSGTATFNPIASLGTPGFTIQQKEVIGGNYSGVFFDDAPTGKSPQTVDGWRNRLSIGKFNGFESGSGLDVTDYDDDDFTLSVTGGKALYAFAFHLINNKKTTGPDRIEALEVTTAGGTVRFGDDTNAGTNGMEGLWVDASGNLVPAGTPGATQISGATEDIPGYVGGRGCIVINECPGTTADYSFLQESFVGIVTTDPSEIFSIINFFEGNSVNDVGIFDLRFAVSAVPLPAGIWLFVSGMIALFGLGRKRKPLG